MTTSPQPPPEAVLIREHRLAMVPHLSLREAARRAGISSPWWRVLETGVRRVKQQDFPESANPETLARMAQVVGVTPAQLAEAGRPDAAAILEKLLAAPPDPVSDLIRSVEHSGELSERQKAHLIDLLRRESREEIRND